MPGKNILYGIAGLIAVIVGFTGKSFYRDFVRLHNISDFGISGFLPSLFYVAGFSLLLLMRPAKFPAVIISVVTIASLLYELKQFGSTGHFDIKDALASVAGGIIAYSAVKLIDKLEI